MGISMNKCPGGNCGPCKNGKCPPGKVCKDGKCVPKDSVFNNKKNDCPDGNCDTKKKESGADMLKQFCEMLGIKPEQLQQLMGKKGGPKAQK